MTALKARRVDEHELHIGLASHADNAMTGRLRLLGGDADARTDKRIQKRRLAYGRPADDRDMAATVR